MAAKMACFALLIVAFLIATSAAMSETSAGKEEHTALKKKEHGTISGHVVPEGFKECFNAIVEGSDCLHDVLKAAYFGVYYLSKECCYKFFVKVGEDCVLAALRFLYPFDDGLTQELKYFCSTVGQ